MIPYTTIPFVSAFFLVLVGVFIGQLFLSRRCHRQHHVISQLQRQIYQQREELAHRSVELDALGQRSHSATELSKQQADELEQLRRDLRIVRSEYSEATARLTSESQARQDLARCLQDEQRQRQCELQPLRAALAKAERQAETQRQLHAAAEQQLHALGDELSKTQKEGDLLRARLRDADERVAVSRRKEQEMQQLLEEACRQSRLLRERVVHVEKSNDALQCELAEAQSENCSLIKQIDEISRVAEQLRTQQRSLEAERAAAMRHRDELAIALQQSQQQQQIARNQTHEALEQLDQSRKDLAVASNELTETLDFERAKCQQLEGTAARYKTQLEDIRQEIDRLALVEDQFVELDAEYRIAKDELKRMRRERDDAREIEAATRQIVGELRDELNERLDAVERLRRDKETAMSQLEFECRRRKQIEEALNQAEARLLTLQNENDGWTKRHAMLFEELASQLDSQQRLAEKLRQRPSVSLDCTSHNETRPALSFRELRLRDQLTRAEEETGLVADPKLGRVYEHPPRRSDDLKKIPGIADRLEERLHQLGVFTYRQIMEWDEIVTAEISRRLGLGDLVQQHDWVAHARRLHREHERNAA
jgi:predicted flap endonuclease-1-like 5' DNA nuclease